MVLNSNVNVLTPKNAPFVYFQHVCGSLGGQERPKCPKWSKQQFLLHNFWCIHYIFLKLGQNMEVIIPNIKPLSQTLGKLWFMSPGTFRAKKHPFWRCFFSNLSYYGYVCLFSGFYGAELKNKCFNSWNCTVCPFAVGIEAFLGLNQGGWWNVGLGIFWKFFQKNFTPRFIFSRCWLHFHWFFLTFTLRKI